MHEVIRRIAIHGTLTAVLLGIIGVVLAEMASSTVLTPTGARGTVNGKPQPDPKAAEIAAGMKVNVPIAMAAWGLGIVVVIEGVRHLLRRGRPVEPPAPRQPDATERLLEELLTQAEAKAAANPAFAGPGQPAPGPHAAK